MSSRYWGPAYIKAPVGKVLTARERSEISYRRMDGESTSELAEEFGVTVAAIRRCPPMERPS